MQVGRDIGANSYNVVAVRRMFCEALSALQDGQDRLRSQQQQQQQQQGPGQNQLPSSRHLAARSDEEKWAEIQRDGQSASVQVPAQVR